MRAILIIVFISLLAKVGLTQSSLSDNKRDYCWIFGYDYCVNPPRSIIKFGVSGIQTNTKMSQMSFNHTNVSICDENGNLLFVTNGMYVADSTLTYMPNGTGLGPGGWYNDFAVHPGFEGYRTFQGALILPIPAHSNKFVIIHDRAEKSYTYPAPAIIPEILATTVDMNLNNGLGDVENKNITIIKDTLEEGCLTATRHGNGRDWWILVPTLNHGSYYKLKLTPNGISDITTQVIGKTYKTPSLGQSVFSPDGSKYARVGYCPNNPTNKYHLELFDFNRCTGDLSDGLDLSFPDTSYLTSIAFSPNSRFLYYANGKRIFQFDLNSSSILLSKTIVGTWDGGHDSIFSAITLDYMQLGPDNRIYITCGYSRYFGTIDSPDSLGIKCNVVQRSLMISSCNALSIPNYPNYRLKNFIGSPCDTLTTSINEDPPHANKEQCRVYPNPVINGILNIIVNTPSSEYSYEIFDSYGNLQLFGNIDGSSNFAHLNISKLSSGVYYLKLHDRYKILQSNKIVVISDQ